MILAKGIINTSLKRLHEVSEMKEKHKALNKLKVNKEDFQFMKYCIFA